MPEIKVNDGGTWRNITELKVNDGGTWRAIQEVQVNDAGTWRTVYLAFQAFFGTLTSSIYNSGYTAGYAKGFGGTLTPNVFATGHSIDNFDQSPPGYLQLVISGFSADPGQNGFWTTVTYGAESRTAASATYSYTPGRAQWYWSGGVLFDGSPKAFSIT